MLEGAVMEYAKWFLGLVSIMFIAVMCIFMFKLNEVNTFQQEVNYQIERHGGLTENAMLELDRHAKANFGGCIVADEHPDSGCLFPSAAGEEKTSGFFVKEFKEEGAGNRQYIVRDEPAPYGDKINYAITRQIGTGKLIQTMNPAVIGSSASRVRGAAPGSAGE